MKFDGKINCNQVFRFEKAHASVVTAKHQVESQVVDNISILVSVVSSNNNKYKKYKYYATPNVAMVASVYHIIILPTEYRARIAGLVISFISVSEDVSAMIDIQL